MKKKLLFLSLFVILIVLFYAVKEYYQDKELKSENILIQEYITIQFIDTLNHVINTPEDKDTGDNFYNSMVLKTYVESVGGNDTRYIVNSKICHVIEEINLSKIIEKYYINFRKKTENNQSIKLEKVFFNGIEKIINKCDNLKAPKIEKYVSGERNRTQTPP